MWFSSTLRTLALILFALVATCPALAASKYSLCIGIDRYPVSPLTACVNDANAWQRFFAANGFTPEPLLIDRAATHDGIQRAILTVLRKAAPGDIVAVQISCHGTLIPGFNPRESIGQDEAIVPFDMDNVIIDDELGDWIDQAAPGVEIYFFMDTCHSGSGTRVAPPPPPTTRSLDPTRRSRFIPATQAMITNAHNRQRRRSTSRAVELDPKMREILFAACTASQTSEENGGNGVFTRAALSVLQSGFAGSNNAFIQRVVAAMGPTESPQEPELSCSESNVNRSLFSIGAGGSPPTVTTPPVNGATPIATISTYDQLLSELNIISGRKRPQRSPVPPTDFDDLIQYLNDSIQDLKDISEGK